MYEIIAYLCHCFAAMCEDNNETVFWVSDFFNYVERHLESGYIFSFIIIIIIITDGLVGILFASAGAEHEVWCLISRSGEVWLSFSVGT